MILKREEAFKMVVMFSTPAAENKTSVGSGMLVVMKKLESE